MNCIAPPAGPLVNIPTIAPARVPRRMTQTEADTLAQRLRVTEAVYSLRMLELETMRLRGDAYERATVRPRRR